MKIIFLDFDGVIIPLPSNGDFEPNPKPSPEAMTNLNIAVNLTGAEVVVTSSWRISRTVTQLADLMKSWGFKGEVYDKTTSSFGDEDRGADILSWLAHYGADTEAFAVVDDEPIDLEEFARVRVMPKSDTGLQFHDASEIVRILNEQCAS